MFKVLFLMGMGYVFASLTPSGAEVVRRKLVNMKKKIVDEFENKQ